MRAAHLACLLLACLLVAGCTTTPPPSDEELPLTDPSDTDTLSTEITVVARDLDTVWEIAFAPGGRIFFTERPGRIQALDGIGDHTPTLVQDMDETVERAESGLMGLALHHAFPDEPSLYVCQTHRPQGEGVENRILRLRLEEGSTGEAETVLDGMDASSIHDGCRLTIGPDGMLYATMGDAARSQRAQDPSSRNGKILRMTPAGEPRGADQPDWDPYVLTIGHRNPQGIAIQPGSGTAFITEHGPENHDEVNVLDPGENYGWPDVRGQDDGDGRYQPSIWTSGPSNTVAPAGAAFIDAPGSPLDGAFVFGTLKAAQLHVLEIGSGDPARVADEHILFEERFGRLRAVVWGSDDALYLGTSNADGRGTPGPQDDRILRVPLSVLEGEALGS